MEDKFQNLTCLGSNPAITLINCYFPSECQFSYLQRDDNNTFPLGGLGA